MDCQGVGSPKKPTTSGDDFGADMDLDTDKSGSNVVTLEPFSSPVMERRKKPTREKSNNVNMQNNDKRMMHILPGIYELVSYNKYLIIQLENDAFQNISPFKANRDIVNACGSEPKIRPQDDGTLLVEVSSPEQSEKLLKMSSIAGRRVTCFPHPFHNQCRGVIYAPELLLLDTEEIQQELEEQNVAKVVRMRKKVGDQVVPLATLILTFKTHRLPNVIKAGWLTFKVKPYIPSPLRCFYCQMFGHSIQKCRRKIKDEPAVCSNCGKQAHGNCSEQPSCINCGEAHPSTSRNCIKFILEKEVQTIKVLEKISFKDARKKALERQIRPGVTFSSVIKNVHPKVQIPGVNVAPQQPPAVATKSNQNETIPAKQHHSKPVEQNPKQSTPINNQNSKSSQQQSTPVNNQNGKSQQQKSKVVETSATATEKAKQSKNTNATRPKASTANSNKMKKKRERTPEKNEDTIDDEIDEPSSQTSVVFQRNAPKLKRAKDKS